MAYGFILFACLQILCLENAQSQAIVPNCGCQPETCCQKPPVVVPACQPVIQPCCQPVIQPCCQPVIQPCCQAVIQPCCQPCCQAVVAQPTCSCAPAVTAVATPCAVDYVASYGIPTATATIIQDDSVANNLANALQLLIVSNLISNTLPLNDVVGLGIPATAQPGLCGQPGFPLATPVLQVVPVTMPSLVVGGCGCGCGVGCGCGCGVGCGCGSGVGCGCGCGVGCGCGSGVGCGCGSDCGCACGEQSCTM